MSGVEKAVRRRPVAAGTPASAKPNRRKQPEVVTVEPANPLDHYTTYRLRVVTSLITAIAARIYATRLNVTIAESRVINIIGSMGPMSTYQVADNSGLDRVKVSRATQRLVGAQLLAREINPVDRRLVTLSLTSEGQARYREILVILQWFEDEVSAALGPKSLRDLRRRLDALERHFSKDPGRPGVPDLRMARRPGPAG